MDGIWRRGILTAGGDARTPFDVYAIQSYLADAVGKGTPPFAVASVDRWFQGGAVIDTLIPFLARRGLRTARVGLLGWSMGGDGVLRRRSPSCPQHQVDGRTSRPLWQAGALYGGVGILPVKRWDSPLQQPCSSREARRSRNVGILGLGPQHTERASDLVRVDPALDGVGEELNEQRVVIFVEEDLGAPEKMEPVAETCS
ncbi:hypothetical protein [Actinomadura madurae]|uniref:hypothetical protein n=1 Tax=Actinomadura madurae TaxID=1993 RepID=UPI000D96E9FC|nr:hypothetical protein [Actinomadura madurae]SPT58783.1 Uncharacterised protein [Actinomadura madurae]